MIENVFESVIIVYSSFYLLLANLIESYGVAAILLSVLISFLLVAPMRWATKIVRNEQEIQRVIEPQLSKIKTESTGEKQFTRISGLYSRYAYHPIYAVRLVSSLFIQLPFFILTFIMFTELQDINGKQFLFIQDLGQADKLLYGGGNLLPFVMTIVNLVAAITTPNFSKKDLKQAVGVSLLFFVLLYNAEAVLLIYWTTNNLILLLRNVHALSKAHSQLVALKLLYRKFILLVLHKDTILFTFVFLVYCVAFTLIFQDGYNLKLTKGLIAGLVVILTGLLISHAYFYGKGLWFKTIRVNNKVSIDYIPVGKWDFLLILFPLASVTQYALLNHDILPVKGLFLLIGSFAIAIFGFCILLPFLIQRIVKLNGLVALSITLTFIYISMPSLAALGAWSIDPDIFLLVSAIAIITILINYAYTKNRKLLYSMAVLIFTASTLNTSYSVFMTDTYSSQGNRMKKVSLSNYIVEGNFKRKPDIYLLTYDSYVSKDLMEKYGIDNSLQEQFLSDNGFKIYANVYSTGGNSLDSMSRVLDINNSLLNSKRNTISGNALVPKILKQQGYKTSAVLIPYFYPIYPSDIAYDYAFPEPNSNSLAGVQTIIQGVGEGKFRFDLDIVGKTLPYTHSDWITAKRMVLSEQSDQPKFLYNHTGPSHSQNSGKCLPNETALFKERLRKANLEMRDDINTIIDSKRESIIIVNSDHGPYLTGDCSVMKQVDWKKDISQFEIQDRYGAFLAIKWPDNKYQEYDNDINVIQQIFEVVFKYLNQQNEVLAVSPNSITIKNGHIPEGLIKDGKISYGKDKGKLLFED